MSYPQNSSSEAPANCSEWCLESYSNHLTTILSREERALNPTATVDATPRPLLGLAMAERSQSLLDFAEAGHASLAVPIDRHNWTTPHNGAPAQTSEDVCEDTDEDEGILWWYPDAVYLARGASPASRRRQRTQDSDAEGDLSRLPSAISLSTPSKTTATDLFLP
jgi:hypothetical protein